MNWGVLHLHSAARAKRDLERRVVEHYDPRYLTRSGSVVQLFTNYLFVALVDNWRSLIRVVGSELLWSDFKYEVPAKVDQQKIDSLKACEVNGLINMKALGRMINSDLDEIRIGQKVLFVDHAHPSFHGMDGTYDGAVGNRVSVLMLWLGAQRRVTVDVGDIG